MEDMSRSEFGKMIRSAFLTVLCVIAVFALTVVYIFWSSAYEWNQKQKQLEFAAQQKALEHIAKVSDVGVYAWVNSWDVTGEKRSVEKLEPETEYIVGQLRYFDVNWRDTGTPYNHVMQLIADDPLYLDPIITFSYKGFLHIKYSIDSEDGWLIYGPTQRGLKTGNLQYLPEAELTSPACDGWGENLITVRTPTNGLSNLNISADNTEVSEKLRQYNYFTDQRLDELYSNVPAEFAGRCRRVWTSHLLVEAYKEDPRIKGAKVLTPTVTFMLRIRSYGDWDLTPDEYKQLIFDIPDLTEFTDYTSHVTVEVIP